MIKYIVIIITILVLIFLIHSIIPTYYNKIFNTKVKKQTQSPGTIMLTFDDGPDKRYIFSLLEVLDRYGIKAIFFMVAENMNNNEDVVRLILEKGHKIGLHSWQHKNAMLYSYFYTKKDFENSYKIIRKFQKEKILYRPPWGHSNIFTNYFARKYNMDLIFWNVMAEDWSQNETVETISKKLLDRVKEHSIICLHDAGENSGGAVGAPERTINALDITIPKLQELGYSFIIDEVNY